MSIKTYQKRCFKEYKTSIGLSEDYRYLFGNPINVQVPIETATNGVMIIGAYPSAKFYTIDGIPDVPILDHNAPFSYESYFDGSRVRSIPSGEELEENYLTPLGINRNQCWITDLVKVFLFKPGHIKRYRELGNQTTSENRSRFNEFGKKSLQWLEEEINLASPKVVILLGQEVTALVAQLSKNRANDYLDGKLHELKIGDSYIQFMGLPHPGIIMKPSPKNPWPERFRKEIIPQAHKEFTELGYYQ